MVTEAVIPVFEKGTQEGQEFHQLCIGGASLGYMAQNQRGRTTCVVDTSVIGALGGESRWIRGSRAVSGVQKWTRHCLRKERRGSRKHVLVR